MAKLYKLGIKREKDRMYFIKSGAVWSTPMKRKGTKAKGRKQIEVKFAGPRDLDYSKNLYYIDKAGDIASSPRGRRRKKKG